MNRNTIIITARKPLLGEDSEYDYYDAKCAKRIESESEFFKQLRFIHKRKIKEVRMVSPYEWTIAVSQ